jgi:hypothetical protein
MFKIRTIKSFLLLCKSTITLLLSGFFSQYNLNKNSACHYMNILRVMELKHSYLVIEKCKLSVT